MAAAEYRVDVRGLDLRERWELLDEIRRYQINHGEVIVFQPYRSRNYYIFLVREKNREGLRGFFEEFGVRAKREEDIWDGFLN